MTLLAMIREHNRLNGYVFAIVEFTIVALAALAIALSGVINDRPGVVIVGAGIAVNALVVSLIGARQLISGVPGGSIRQFRVRAHRDAIGKANPHLMHHTLLICLATLLPFVLAVVTVFQRLTQRHDTPAA